jgi:hypothetical protein
MAVFLSLIAVATAGEMRVWQFQSGARFQGAFVQLSGTNVIVERGGKEYTLALDKLSQTDRDYVQEQPQPFEIFGVRLGQKFVPGMATAREIQMPSPPPGIDPPPPILEYVFQPKKPAPEFSHYYVRFTPQTKIIYEVYASADFPAGGKIGAVLDAREKLEAALEERYGKRTTRSGISPAPDVDEFVFSGVVIGVYWVVLPYAPYGERLWISYTDKNLEAQAQKELSPTERKEREALKGRL